MRLRLLAFPAALMFLGNGYGCAEQSDGTVAPPEVGGSSGKGGAGSSGKGGTTASGKGGSTSGKGGSGGTSSSKGGSTGNGGEAGDMTGAGGDPASGGTGGSGGKGGTGGSAGKGGSGGSGGITCEGSGGAPPDSGVSVRYKVSQAADTPDLEGDLWIYNESGASVNMTELTLRYYFTNEAAGGAAEQATINYANKQPISGGSAEQIQGNMTISLEAATGCDQDTVAVIGFTTGTLANDERVEFRFHVHNNDSVNYQQADDYSFNINMTTAGGTEWDHVVLRQNSTVLWGIDP
jgi:hypothetical protein